MVIRVAKRYHGRGLNFCIITFYDPQRAAIAKALEAANLSPACVYNVDSFQGMGCRLPSWRVRTTDPNFNRRCWLAGNEADYVILSSVRTQQPGFLNSQPRMNVALTRCRKGMVAVTDKSFLQGAGRSTLLGQLCSAWSQYRDPWIGWKTMLANSVELPGLPSPPPPPPPPTRPVVVPQPRALISRAVPALASSSRRQPQSPPASRKIDERSRPAPRTTKLRWDSLGSTTTTDRDRASPSPSLSLFPPLSPSPASGATAAPAPARGRARGRRGDKNIDKEFPSLLPLSAALDLDVACSGKDDDDDDDDVLSSLRAHLLRARPALGRATRDRRLDSYAIGR
jgi:hypothetical protein